MSRVLIANRGEIACRIIRSCRALGLESVAVYSDADAKSKHVELADEAVRLGPPRPAESYLLADRILEAARESGARAIHPGYGFLSENSGFARAVEGAGLVWVGPRAETIEAMGDKDRARALAGAAGVPVLGGSRRFVPEELDGIETAADEVGYPLLVKASAGGGGIGMRLVKAPGKLAKVVAATQSMAERSFGDGAIFLERYIERARHIEVQVFGLGDGRVVHLFERECSIQRRFQKVIEEAPAPNLPDAVRKALAEAAVSLASRERYAGAGTVEFILDDATGEFFFLEMNTRIQVEHPVSEEITGLDLVGLQLRLALGEDLSELRQEDIEVSGAAIECRLYAENPEKKFMPAPGELDRLEFAEGAPGVRIESGVRSGDAITPFYDPMIAKIVAHGSSRAEAIARMRDALAATQVEGLVSNLGFLARLVAHSAFADARTHTGFIDEHAEALLSA